MIDLSKVEQKRLVKLIRRGPKGMPESPRFTEKPSTCMRCGGQGGHEGWKFTGWTCYRCGGSGKDPKHLDYKVMLEEASPEWSEFASAYIEKLDAAAEKRRAKKEAKRVAEVKERDDRVVSMIESNEVLKKAVAAGEKLAEADSFAAGVLETVQLKGFVSEKQEAIIERGLESIAKRAAEKAAERPVVEGRIEISGKVLTTKWQESEQWGSTLKMLVRDDRGFKVWGSVPSAISVERGDEVVFTATVEKSNDDECFGFFKRPSKAKVVGDEPEEQEETPKVELVMAECSGF